MRCYQELLEADSHLADCVFTYLTDVQRDSLGYLRWNRLVASDRLDVQVLSAESLRRTGSRFPRGVLARALKSDEVELRLRAMRTAR
jgi:hypothetical protein